VIALRPGLTSPGETASPLDTLLIFQHQMKSAVCFSIEPGIYQEGKFGVRSEINVYISDKDIEVTDSQSRRILFQS
jgi:hypothetical protein